MHELGHALAGLVVVLPLIMLLVLGGIFRAGIPTDMAVAVIDHDRSDLSRGVTRMLDAAPELTVTHRATDLSEARSLIVSGAVRGAVLMPPNLERDITRGERPEGAVDSGPLGEGPTHRGGRPGPGHADERRPGGELTVDDEVSGQRGETTDEHARRDEPRARPRALEDQVHERRHREGDAHDDDRPTPADEDRADEEPTAADRQQAEGRAKQLAHLSRMNVRCIVICTWCPRSHSRWVATVSRLRFTRTTSKNPLFKWSDPIRLWPY